VCALVLVADGHIAQAGHDSEAPTWPAGSEVVVDAMTSTTATLSWTSAVDNIGVAGYRLYRGASVFATTSVPTVTLKNLDPGTDYDLRVEAFDAEGNESSPGGDFVLQSRVDVYAGTNAHSIKGVDVDRDGSPDLVSAVAGEDGVSILLGNGDGTFGSPSVYESGVSATAIYPKNALVVDLNSDGDVDLVTANHEDDSIGILLGIGDGTFGTAIDLATCNGTHDVAVGNFVGSSAIDVAAVCWGANTMTVWTGNGNGTFKDRKNIATGEPVGCIVKGLCAHGIVAADLNGPGNDDVAIAAYGGVSANVLLGNGAGFVGVTPAVDVVTGNPHDIAVGDFDGDGNPDLVTADESSNTVTVLLGASNGSGSFSVDASYAAAFEPKGVTVGDVNGDGDLDIAVASSGGNYPKASAKIAGDFVTILLGNGDGTFRSGGRYGGYIATDAAALFDVAIVDLNDDGVADVAASDWTNGNISIFFGGASSGGPSTSFTTPDDPPVAVDDGPYSVVFGGSVSRPAPGVLGNDSDDGGSMTAVKTSDPSHGTVVLNADGSFTYTNNGDPESSDSFTYEANDSAGAFSNEATVRFSITEELPDVHTTGLVDTGQGKWQLYDVDGNIETAFFYGNPGDFPIMGDWDGDGVETPGMYRQSDGYVYLRNSNSQGIAHIRFFFGDPGDVPIAGDFNSDGFDTVSIYRPSNQTFYIINELGKNDGGLGPADFSYVFGNPGDKPFVGDFNGNGEETVGLHRESTGLVYYRNEHSAGNADNQFIFGDPGDRLIAGDWTGNGPFTPALFRPSNTTMYFKYTNGPGNADDQWSGGKSTWVPVSGSR
jgi:hypothetical protein